jgi:hypothetical protein
MAYTPINWQTGDTITAEKLNKMDNGWGIQNTQLFSETVTTVAGDFGNSATLAYSDWIRNDTIIINFDGTDYTCDKITLSDTIYGYGGAGSKALDFTEYPFALVSVRNGSNTLYTETAGTHTISVAAPGMQTSDNFRAAVVASAGGILWVNAEYDSDLNGYTLDKTKAEIAEAISAGYLCLFKGGLEGQVYADSNNVVVSDYLYVQADATPPLLRVTKYAWDDVNSVITEQFYIYELTAASGSV